MVRAHSASDAPSRARPSATALPSPWLEAATIATRPLSPRSIGLPAAQVRVVLGQPIVTDGTEDVEIERVLERDRAVRDIRRNSQHLALRHHHFAPLQLELERALHDVRDLLALMEMLGYHRPFGEEDLRHHGLVARDDAPRNDVAHRLFFHLVPRVVF